MRKAAARIQKQAPEVAERYRQQLLERIKAAGLEAPARKTSGCSRKSSTLPTARISPRNSPACKAISSSSKTAANPGSRWAARWISWRRR